MPDLPTITLSQAHFDRVVAAFPGATLAAKADAYKRWLTNRLIERVEVVETRRIDAESNASKQAALAALTESLPTKTEEPELP